MDDPPRIKILASDDNLKILGELLSNESSRKIIQYLMNGEMYKNELSLQLNLPSNLVGHHLDKLEKLGLLEITERKLKRKHLQSHKFYKINSDIFITVNKTQEEIKESGLLKKIFKEGTKFASIGIASLVVWFSDLTHYLENSDVYPVPFGEIDTSHIDPLTPSLIIIIIGLVIERIYSVVKKKKKS